MVHRLRWREGRAESCGVPASEIQKTYLGPCPSYWLVHSAPVVLPHYANSADPGSVAFKGGKSRPSEPC